MKFFFCVCFLVASCGSSVGIIREYSYHYDTGDANWYYAQWFCRTYYKDLATVTTAEEHQRLVGIGVNGVSGWIGLYMTNAAQNWTWMWSDGEEVSFSNWKYGSPLTGLGNQSCSFMDYGYWNNDDCGWNHPFYCYRYLILVNERKTWEEALQYCNTHYSGLASLPYHTQLLQAKTELALTQTVNVWIGIHFNGRYWYWVSGEPLGTMFFMPSCPARPYRCGALNTVKNVWENQDCNEKWNFLCYWR